MGKAGRRSAAIPLSESGDPAQLTVSPDFLAPNGVNQIAIEPTRIWLHVEGGVGAHSGTCNVLSFDGTSLTMETSAGNASPGVCAIQDVNGDGQNEVIVDESDAYVFCYACGVRLPNFGVLGWNGSQLARVEFEALPPGAPSALDQLNDEILRLVKAGLWKSALSTVDTARIAGADPGGVFAWNTGLVRLTGEARKGPAEQPEHPFPLLARLFYGDYPGAIDVMRPYSVTAVFDQPSAIIEGTVASGWESEVSYWITSTVEPALAIQPQLAGAHFLRGYALWLQDPTDPVAAQEIARAAELSPDDPYVRRCRRTCLAKRHHRDRRSDARTNDRDRSPCGQRLDAAPARSYYSAQVDGVDTILGVDLGESSAPPTEGVDPGQPASIDARRSTIGFPLQPR